MRVLLTGSSGYIGSVMAKTLVDEGFDVIGCDTGFFEDCNFVEMEYKLPTLQKDVRDITSQDLKGFDAVLHLAALSNDPMGDLHPILTDEINHVASLEIAKLCKKVGCRRFILASSCSMYGVSGDRALTEEAPFNPASAYATSKVQSEWDISRLADSNFSPTFLRCATAYGVSPKMRFDLVLNNLTGWAFTTGRAHITSDGTPWRPIVHIEDISRAFLAALEAPIDVVHNQAFNVGQNSQNFTVRTIAEIVKSTIPQCEIEFARGAAPDPRNYRVDFSKITRMLPEFKPCWTVEKGARELYDTFKARGLTKEEFESRRYTRLKQLRHLLETGALSEKLRWRA